MAEVRYSLVFWATLYIPRRYAPDSSTALSRSAELLLHVTVTCLLLVVVCATDGDVATSTVSYLRHAGRHFRYARVSTPGNHEPETPEHSRRS